MRTRNRTRPLRTAVVALALLVVGAPGAVAQEGDAPALESAALGGLELRTIGPAVMSGRIVDLAVVEADPYVFYVASATGGVWKTTDNGVTFTPVFQDEGTHSVGDIAVHQQDTSVVWVGTGERANRQSNSWGDGVYRSVDGGRSWTNMGLRDSHHIGRIVLHPSDPDIVYVAAMGHLWGPNEARGLYRSTNGGDSWERILYVDENTGFVDVAMDPQDPEMLYAASYQRRRRAYAFHGGGPGSGLWKTTDGGDTWTELTSADAEVAAREGGAADGDADDAGPAAASATQRDGATNGGPHAANGTTTLPAAAASAAPAAADSLIGPVNARGLPTTRIGRIGITIFRRDPRIVWISLEQGVRYNASTAYQERRAGLFRSTDRGETWEYRSDWNPRPMYASQPLVDPNHPGRVYMLNSYSYWDDVEGEAVRPRQSLHGDDRILWVNPADSRHVIKGDDGGVGISYDRGRRWLYVTSLPVSQFYRVGVDQREPYWVYGGLQDNGSWAGPNATYRREGVLNGDWIKTGGGDGFKNVVDPSDGGTLYNESQYLGLQRYDLATGESQDLRPGDPTGHIGGRRNLDVWYTGEDPPLLGNAMEPANWDGPFIISPHDPNTIYAGTDELWKSTDRGMSWTSLGDLTSGVDRRELEVMGQRPDSIVPSLDDGVPYHPTLTIVAESPLREALLYVGADDGTVRVSPDGGEGWTELTGRFPGLPGPRWVSDIEPSRHDEGTVYLSFDGHTSDDYANYIYRSTDYGESWTPIVGDMTPERVVRALHEDPRNPDLLYAGTELGVFFTVDGGGHWVELRNNLPTVAVNDLLVHPRDNDLVLGTHGRGIWILDQVTALQELTPDVLAADAHLFGIEPAAMIRYGREKGHTGDMVFRGDNPPAGAIIDYWLREARDSGEVVLTVHDATGDELRRIVPAPAAGVNRVVWDLRHGERAALPRPDDDDDDDRTGPDGPFVVPGEYTVRLAVAGRTWERAVEVRDDPRLDVAPAERRRWTRTLLEIGALYDEVTEDFAAVRDAVDALQEERAEDDDELADARELRRLVGELRSRVRSLYRSVSGWTGDPTADQRSRFDYYRELADRFRPRVDALAGAAATE